MKITRDEIKSKVINTAYFSIGDYFETTMNTSPNDGEDLLLYKELKFDSLDIATYIIDLERVIGVEFNNGEYFMIDDTIFNGDITFRIIIDYIYNKLKDN
jgi:acyl carrier protein